LTQVHKCIVNHETAAKHAECFALRHLGLSFGVESCPAGNPVLNRLEIRVLRLWHCKNLCYCSILVNLDLKTNTNGFWRENSY